MTKLVAGHQIGLELEQKGTVVEAVMTPINQGITDWTGERLQPK